MITGEKSRRETDRRLAEMEAHLTAIYSRASKELDEKVLKYFARFEAADARKAAEVAAGKLDPEEYAGWRKKKILYGEQYKKFQESVTNQLAHVNETALAYINGEMPEVYVLNYNDMGTLAVNEINQHFGKNMSFELVNAETVRILASEDPQLVPRKKLDIPKDKRWNAKKMQSEILQGIIQGEGIPQITKRLYSVQDETRTDEERNLLEANKRSALLNARTMVTSAQNRGRLDSMRRCRDSLGVITQKYWLSSDQPGRTRNWHMSDAFKSLFVDIEEPFVNELGEIMCPGDPAAAPANIWGCRCRLCETVIGFIDPDTGNFKKIK